MKFVPSIDYYYNVVTKKIQTQNKIQKENCILIGSLKANQNPYFLSECGTFIFRDLYGKEVKVISIEKLIQYHNIKSFVP
jgi:hypothetical protein